MPDADEPTVIFDLVIVEDDIDEQKRIADLFRDDERMRVIGFARTVRGALGLARAADPDLIILDDVLAGKATGVDSIGRFRMAAPRARLVIHTTAPSAAESSGADAVVAKGDLALLQWTVWILLAGGERPAHHNVTS